MKRQTVARLTAFLDAWLSFHCEHEGLPGLSVAIYSNQDILYKKTVSAVRRPMPTELYNIGSQSKMLTALILLRLAQEGTLDLRNTAITYVPWLAAHPDPRAQQITIEHLLWHGAGLVRDGLQADYWQLLQPFPDRQTLRRLACDSPLVFDPGFKLKYSNLGYALLGQIAEAASGVSYDGLAYRYIITPLALSHTYPHLPPNEPIAPGYHPRYRGRYVPLRDHTPTNTLAPAAGWYSTPEETARIVSALTQTDSPLLQRPWHEMLLHGVRHHWHGPARRGSEYGLGMMSVEAEGQKLLGHSGSFITHRSATFTDLASGTTVAVMAANKDAPATDILLGIFDAIGFFAAHDAPAPDWQKYTGLYQNALVSRFVIALPNGLACVYVDDWSPFGIVDHLEPRGEHTFRIASTPDFMAQGEDVKFALGPDGEVSSLRYAGITMWPSHQFAAQNRWFAP
ncbi:MAG TPA: serine hydrolase domain-containing protein [Candidatus Saccharimonadales bacterium]|nr:serine hydrolase domain-containing protein [Candidatus Saccharimonadales bacterium]